MINHRKHLKRLIPIGLMVTSCSKGNGQWNVGADSGSNRGKLLSYDITWEVINSTESNNSEKSLLSLCHLYDTSGETRRILTERVKKEWSGRLHKAVSKGYRPLVRILLENDQLTREQINKLDEKGMLPLFLAIDRAGLWEDNHNDADLKMVELLLAHGASDGINTEINIANRGRGFVFEQRNNGFTPLLIALFRRKFAIAQLLVEHGADVNQACTNYNIYINQFRTPLLQAVDKDDINMVGFLIAHGAFKSIDRIFSINTINNMPETSALIVAAEHNNLPMVQLLMNKGANNIINCEDCYGRTALSWAVHHENIDMAKFLIETGANMDLYNQNGITLLFMAACSNNLPMVQLLIDKGADRFVNWPVNRGKSRVLQNPHPLNDEYIEVEDPCSHEEGETPLLVAVGHENLDMVQLLIKNGAADSVNKATKSHETPWSLAKFLENEAIMALLAPYVKMRSMPHGGDFQILNLLSAEIYEV